MSQREHEICPRCQCCSLVHEQCTYCGGEGGIHGDELVMEDPLWYTENDFRPCDVCNGEGGFIVCVGNCDKNGNHKKR